VKGKRTCFARGPWYAGNGSDGISRRVIAERVCSVGDNAARDSRASTCVDAAADGRGRYVAARNWQNGRLHYPHVARRGKLPDLVGRNSTGDVESAEYVKFVVEYRKATRQNVGRARRPG